jgi:hypothetical protein
MFSGVIPTLAKDVLRISLSLFFRIFSISALLDLLSVSVHWKFPNNPSHHPCVNLNVLGSINVFNVPIGNVPNIPLSSI